MLLECCLLDPAFSARAIACSFILPLAMASVWQIASVTQLIFEFVQDSHVHFVCTLYHHSWFGWDDGDDGSSEGLDEDDRISRGLAEIADLMRGVRHTSQLTHVRGTRADVDLHFRTCDVRQVIILAASSRDWLEQVRLAPHSYGIRYLSSACPYAPEISCSQRHDFPIGAAASLIRFFRVQAVSL